jgi:capsule biosynthesis phosphatase
MKYIILCGGIGKRNNDYSLPKPLNYINGKHMIEHIIENINSNEIYIIFNSFLNEYNFCEIIIEKFKEKSFHFSCIDYLTRGAVETAFIGLQKFTFADNENLLFIDNDNLHTFNEISEIDNYDYSFIGYGIDYDKTNYSFIQISDNNIINIEEKNKISDFYCCGLYGFKNMKCFNFYAKQMLLDNIKIKNEFYFSRLYKIMIENKDKILPVFINKTIHVGTYSEIINNKDNVPKKKLRICFDLDNTLVTNPTNPGDYTTVKPIHKNINMLNYMKNEGNEIIIYTARRMRTHHGNVGKVIKDIASITLDTLNNFNIYYDELIFGKPIADIYIDDKCINPYKNKISYFGLFYDENTDFIPNKIKNNKYNTIKKVDNIITKTGPYDLLKGELYYYQNIPDEFKDFFSAITDFNKLDKTLEIKMNYISGIPLYYLYKNKLLTEKHIDELFYILDLFHNYSTNKINITEENVKNNYILKIKNRFNNIDYTFDDSKELLDEILNGLEEHFDPKIVNMIHGDFWFSNIIYTYEENYVLIDMKGQVDNILTINGDIYYDYSKLYQSILGYDLVLNDENLDMSYINTMKKYFLTKCSDNNLNIDFLRYTTKGLIFGTFNFMENISQKTKNNVWNLIKQI